MIFVTVGTHEQQFNRLIKEVDKLRRSDVITEDVIIQTGFSTYEPKYCKWQSLYTFSEMNILADEARIMITHGGPSSFIMALQRGRIPIVIPRQKKFGEHVNNHQVMFCEAVKQRYGNIIVVEEISNLATVIKNYDKIVNGMKADAGALRNNAKFVAEFEKMANQLVGK